MVQVPGLVIATLAALMSVSNGYSYFQQQIPNGDRVPNPCNIEGVWDAAWPGVGHRNHAGSGTRNQFGLDWANNEHKWNETVCRQDSDGDGLSNGAELGDPDCEWTPGKVPKRTTNLSHPGICEPLDSLDCQAKNFWLDCYSTIPFECPAFDEPETQRIDLRVKPTRVPPVETKYMCTAFTFPAKITSGDFHMIGGEAIIGNANILHHVTVYGCPDNVARRVTKLFKETAECINMATEHCNEMIFLWAVGTDPDCFDPEFGVRLGLHGFKTVIMEFHWNNPLELRNEMDDSGVRFYYTPKLRKHDAQTIFVGPADLELPPGKPRVAESFKCPSECTQYMFPEPVFISYISPHMHLTGSGMLVQLIRDDEVIRTLLNADEFDYNNPRTNVFRPHVQVLPGDEIKVECYFNTTGQKEFKYFGQATSDEMCIAIIQYYPKQANATDCWGIEYDEGDIAHCGFLHREEVLYPCYAQYGYLRSDSDLMELMDDLRKAYKLLLHTCDPIGQRCLPGCNEVIQNIMKNKCFGKSVDGWIKVMVLPYLEHIYDDFNRAMFIQALTSCDKNDTICDKKDAMCDKKDNMTYELDSASSVTMHYFAILMCVVSYGILV